MSLAEAQQTGSSQETSLENDLQAVRTAIHKTPQTHSTTSSFGSSIASSGTKTEPSSYGTGTLHTERVMISKNSKLFSASIKLQLAQDVVEFIRHKREVFAANLAKLEKFTGPFKPGWKQERVACLEQVWIDEFARDMLHAHAVDGPGMLMPRVNRSSSAFETGLATPASITTKPQDMEVVMDIDDSDGGGRDEENSDELLKEKWSMHQLTPNTTPASKLPVWTSRPSSTKSTLP